MTTQQQVPPRPVIAVGWRAVATLTATTVVGLVAFLWPFLAQPGSGLSHSADAPWLFVLLVALLAALVVAELSDGGLDAKTVAVLGVLAAASRHPDRAWVVADYEAPADVTLAGIIELRLAPQPAASTPI